MTTPFSWTVRETIAATGGTLLSGGNGRHFTGIGIDSRSITSEDWFLAIKGETHDGHSFVMDVVNQGVKGVIIDIEKVHDFPAGDLEKSAVTCIGVKDTLKALGSLAAYRRRQSGVSVVALTGSNGKTSTRAMAADIAARKYRVLATTGNMNNEIGMPLTLLKLESEHEWAVLELGMNRPGEIGRLADICAPDIGLITNIGPAHLEGLGSLEGVMHAKGELLPKVKPGGKIILNADDPQTIHLTNKTTREPIFFGLADKAHIRGTQIAASASGMSFVLNLPHEKALVNMPVNGKFMVLNALAAAAIGYCLTIPAREITGALASFTPVKGRMNIRHTTSGIHIIDDTYNANPYSMKTAADTLEVLKRQQRGIAVLGDMLELGETSPDLHRDVGRYFAQLDLVWVFASGNFADAVARGAREGGLSPQRIVTGSKDDIFRQLKKELKPKDWILIKGSRGMRMETLVQDLLQEFDRHS